MLIGSHSLESLQTYHHDIAIGKHRENKIVNKTTETEHCHSSKARG